MTTEAVCQQKDPDLVYVVEQNVVGNIPNKESSTHPPAKITYPQRIIHGILQQKQKRQYNRARAVQSIANDKFERTGKGLTYWDLYKDRRYKLVSTDKQARNTLYYSKNAGFLHPSPVMTIPQQYFATKDQAELAAIKNTHSQTTGVQQHKNMHISERSRAPLTNVIEHLKARDFYHALLLTEGVPLGIHNIRLDFILNDPNAYSLIQASADLNDNRAKKFERRTGDALVKYKISPHGKVEIAIICSNHPFRLETEQDATELFGFVAGVRDYLMRWVSDTSAKIVPPLHSWRLIHADLNKDVPAKAIMAHIKPNIELKIAERVFRLYAKTIGHENFLRVEEMRTMKDSFDRAIDSIIDDRSRLSSSSLQPAVFLKEAELKSKIASLTEQLAQMEEVVANLVTKNENSLARKDIANTHKKILNPATATACDNDSEQQDSTLLHSRDHRGTGQGSKGQEQVSAHKREEIFQRDAALELISAASLYHKEKSKPRISTGSRSFDELLGGGLEAGSVTEFYGKAGSGKTQLCFTLTVTAQQDLPSHNWKASKVLFIDTENTFTSKRICEIAKARGFEPDLILKNIYLWRANNASDLQAFIENSLPAFLEKDHGFRLVIIDSIISRHRAELRGRENLPQRQQILNVMIQFLKRLADKFELAVMVTNQLVEDPDSYFADTTTTHAAGGNIMAHASTHRLMLKLTGKSDKRIARMVDSPCYPVRDALFSVNHQGIVDGPTRYECNQ